MTSSSDESTDEVLTGQVPVDPEGTDEDESGVGDTGGEPEYTLIADQATAVGGVSNLLKMLGEPGGYQRT